MLKQFLTQWLAEPISKQLSTDLINDLEKRLGQEKTHQWEYPMMFNSTTPHNRKPKPEGSVNYSKLRSLSIHYTIARSCINYLKNKIQKLEWRIENVDGEEIPESLEKELVAFFKKPLGHASSYREMIDAIVEDYLVIGAFSMEKIKTRGNKFLGELKIVSPETIKLMVDEYGRIPRPPSPAYKQFIRGAEVASLTTDQLLYVRRSARSNSAYGLSPLESLIIQAESALQGALFSLHWFQDGNIPEGFIEMPEGTTAKQIKEYQNYFDSMMSGNFVNRSKLKVVPSGFKYTPAKKPDDIGYERFEKWLLNQTCAVFGVPPEEIGFNHNSNRSTGESMSELGQELGMRPIANVLQETFDRIIQEEFGYTDLCFRYVDLDPVDQQSEIDLQRSRLELGIDTLDEVRISEGKEPLGVTYLASNLSQLVDGKDLEPTDDEKKELALWRKQSMNAVKRGDSFKKFKSEVLSEDLVKDVYKKLERCSDKNDVYELFDLYMTGKAKKLNSLEKILDELS